MTRDRRDAPLVRHRPAREPNALADYVQQSLDALEAPKAAPRRRRPRRAKRSDAKISETVGPWTVRVSGLVEPDELEHDDEFEDIVANLRKEFAAFGEVAALSVDRTTGDVSISYAEQAAAVGCVDAKHGQTYGGRPLTAILEPRPTATPKETDTSVDPRSPPQDPPKRKRPSKIKNAVRSSREATAQGPRAFVVRPMVEADEVEDDDEYADVVADVTAVLARHGALVVVVVIRSDDEDPNRLVGDVVVEYVTVKEARTAFATLDQSRYGGRTLECAWIEPSVANQAIVTVDGLVEAEELEDDDEHDDVCDEIQRFMGGAVADPTGISIARDTGRVTLCFEDQAAATVAVETLKQKSYGGRKLIPHQQLSTPTAPPTPSVSNALRVPSANDSEAMVTLLATFLQRLAALQERAHVQNPLYDKRSRRLVLGLHEVRRGLQNHKIKLLVLASDFDACEVVDDKLEVILAIATRDEVPIVRALTRRKLGRILKKHARVSCIGVYSYDGANDEFRDILRELNRLERLTNA